MAQVSEKAQDRLESIFRMQRGLTEMMDLSRYPDDKAGRVSALCTAMIHEAIELQATTNWKWWKRPTPFEEAEAREELIDIWHFLIQASIELDLSPDDILNEYRRKNEINRQRQKDGY